MVRFVWFYIEHVELTKMKNGFRQPSLQLTDERKYCRILNLKRKRMETRVDRINNTQQQLNRIGRRAISNASNQAYTFLRMEIRPDAL